MSEPQESIVIELSESYIYVHEVILKGARLEHLPLKIFFLPMTLLNLPI